MLGMLSIILHMIFVIVQSLILTNSLQPHGLQHAKLHYVLEFTQTHTHRASDALQPSHPLPSPSPPAFNLSQHQGLFQ